MFGRTSAVVFALALLASCGTALDRPPSAPFGTVTVESRTPALPVNGDEKSVLDGPSTSGTSAPPRTWTALYSAYLGPGTEGACGRSSACHADVVKDAASTYEWLSGRGYIAGTQSALVSRTSSCLRWFGGNMPPRGTSNAEAARELEAWVAVGAPRD